jgi:hypothetical protein
MARMLILFNANPRCFFYVVRDFGMHGVWLDVMVSRCDKY